MTVQQPFPKQVVVLITGTTVVVFPADGGQRPGKRIRPTPAAAAS